MSEPTLRIVPSDGVRSDAKLACEIGADYGYPVEPWQFDLIDDILRERPNGRFAAPVFGYSLPRRNGKSYVVIILTLYFMLVHNAEVIYSAHHSRSADEVWTKVRELFTETELAAYVKGNISNREGREAIELNEGGSFRIFSRAVGKGAGRGSEADVLILDEALDLSDEALDALEPTVAGSKLSTGALTLYLGSPSEDDKSVGVHFRRLRTRALRGDNPRAAWVEWAAPEGADIHDPAIWRMCNPALATGRLPEDFFAGRALSSTRKGFLREHLGSWAGEARQTVVELEHWSALADPTASLPREAPKVWAVDAASDGSVATIVAAAELPSGKRYVEKVARLSGTSWVSQKVIDNCKTFPEIERVLIDAKGPLAHLADEWRRAGVPVVVTDWDYLANAAVSFVQSVDESSFKHQGDGELERSVRSATAKPLAGRYKFVPYDSGDPDCDITGVTAMSLALYALKSDKAFSKTKKPKTGNFSIGGKVYKR